jgi:signal transduction histidine kinase
MANKLLSVDIETKLFTGAHQAIPQDRLRGEMDRELASMLPSLTLGLALVYALFSAVRLFFVETTTRNDIIALNLAAAALLGILHVISRWEFVKKLDAHLAGATVALTILIHSLIHLAITCDFLQSANILFLIIGIGCLATSLRWHILASCMSVSSALILIRFLSIPNISAIGLMLLQAMGLSFVLFFVRNRNLREAIALRMHIQEQNESLANTNQALSQARETAEAERMVANQARDEATQANMAKRVFLAHMTHELRTPLTAMLGYCELLAISIKEAQHTQYQTDIQGILLAGNHLKELINSVLDMSKIEAGRLELVENAIDINQVAEYVMASIRPLADQNQNQLQIQIPEAIPSFIADEMRLRQILINLLSNACRFTYRGAVLLRIECIQSASRSEETYQHWIVMQISDNGIGMTKEQVERLFQDFIQVGALPQVEQHGSGLGLALSQRLARLMGGDIEVQSEPDVGSTFRVFLPMRSLSPE